MLEELIKSGGPRLGDQYFKCIERWFEGIKAVLLITERTLKTDDSCKGPETIGAMKCFPASASIHIASKVSITKLDVGLSASPQKM